MIIIDALKGMTQMLAEYWYVLLIAVAALLVLLFILRYIRMFFSRIAFLFRLGHICRKKDAKIVFKGNFIFNSSFHKNENFIVTACDKKTYAVKILPVNTLRRNVYVKDRNEIFVTKAGAQNLVGRGASVGDKKQIVNRYESKKRRIRTDMSIAGDFDEKILLLQPEPLNVYVLKGNGYGNIGSGEKLGELTLFEAGGFTDYLSRIL